MRVSDLKPEVAIALVALSVSSLPPLLPHRGEKAGGGPEYGLALVVILAVLAVPVILLSAEVLQLVFGRDYAMTGSSRPVPGSTYPPSTGI